MILSFILHIIYRGDGKAVDTHAERENHKQFCYKQLE